MSEDIIDLEEVLERVMDDRELLMELLGDFVNDYSDKRKQFRKAIAAKRFDEIKDIAHALKSAAGNISVKTMHNSLNIVEQLADNKDSNLIAEVMTDLDNQFTELKEYIEVLKKQ